MPFARCLGDFGATMMVAGNIPGLTQTASLAIYDAVQAGDPVRAGWLTLWISFVSIAALWLVQRTLPVRGSATLNAARSTLDVRLIRRIHAGLTLDVTFAWARSRRPLRALGVGQDLAPAVDHGTLAARPWTCSAGPYDLFDSARGVDQPLRRRRIGMIFQDDLLFPHLSVADNIRFGLKGKTTAEQTSRLAEVAALCGVEHLLRRRP